MTDRRASILERRLDAPVHYIDLVGPGTPVAVLGTGGMGREAVAWLSDCGRAADVVGFLDDDPTQRGSLVGEVPVVGGVDWLDADAAVEVVLAVGDPGQRAALLQRMTAAGVNLATIVHPSAMIGPRVTVGEGTIVCPAAVLTCDIEIGRAVIVNYGAMVGHDGRIGDAAFVAPGAHVAGAVTIGARAYVGIGASIRQGITIGEDAVVGAGAAVVCDVEPGATVVGVPARPLASRI